MSCRTTEDKVKAIMETALTAAQIAPFMGAANALVNERMADSGYGDELLAQIETYLVAHFASLRDPAVESETADEATYHYEGKTGMGLNRSGYGQMAMVLDYNGWLVRAPDGQGEATWEVIA